MYGFLAPRALPQQNSERLMLLLDRWQRSFGATQKWAVIAKQCVDFVEGRQWDEKLLAKMNAEGRPALTINKTNRLMRLMMGYFSNNRTDLKAHALADGSDQTADAITAIMKQLSIIFDLPSTDGEVFHDGIMTGRGYYDTRLSFEKNDFGEAKSRASDPFSTYIDPDTQSYDLNEDCGFIIDTKYVCLDEVEYLYGKAARDSVEPFVYNRTPLSYYSPAFMQGETTPIRRFGNTEDTQSEWWDSVYGMLGSFVDPLRKSLLVLDAQYKMLTPTKMFVDLETGDRREIPDDWSRDRIQKVLYWAQQYAAPLSVDIRPCKRIRWTTVIGDTMVYDGWSPYTTYTKTGFFPYFRRGITRGMVEDLMDPNREINKRRSARIDTVMRMAHSGWKYHESALDPVMEANLKRHGAESGVNVKWKGPQWAEPKKIEPSAPPQGLRELEKSATDDMHEVSGINESALGEIDIGQSGRAIEARQRQAVIAVQPYLTNMSRSKKLLGFKYLEIVQQHYTEARVFKIVGAKSGQEQMLRINQPDPVGALINDVTSGTYHLSIDERPLADTFASAQFNELLEILQKLGPIGQMVASARPDLIVEMSSLPNKDEWKEALMQAAAQLSGGVPPGGVPPGPGSGVPPSAGPSGARPPASNAGGAAPTHVAMG